MANDIAAQIPIGSERTVRRGQESVIAQIPYASRPVAKRSFWFRFFRLSGGTAPVLLLTVLVLSAVFAPIVAPYGPRVQDRAATFQPPTGQHWFGTDELGRDILSRVIYGGQISLLTSAVAVAIALIVGVPLGLVAGFFGGLPDTLIMRCLDCLLAIPAILLAMVIVAILGPGSLNVMVAVGIVSIPSFARLARASTLSIKEREYVTAALSAGARPSYLMFRTILPNTLNPIIVQVAVVASLAMLLEASLSFLGLGTQPPEASWGSMLNQGRSYLYQAPWYGIFPGVAVTLAVLSLNTLADAAQAAFDTAGAGRVADFKKAG